MDWHERTERQVGARGIEELRQWLSLSEAADAAARPAPAHLASLVAIALAVAVAVLIGPSSQGAAATPLPAGTYSVPVATGAVDLSVDEAGRPALTVSDGLLVRLALDEQGRVLDEFTVLTPTEVIQVDLDAGPDGTEDHTVTITTASREALGEDGAAALATLGEATNAQAEVVRAVAACAPRGQQAAAAGWPSHSTLVSAAASRLAIEVPAAPPGRVARADFSTPAGARAFCELAAEIVPSRSGQPADRPADRHAPEETEQDPSATGAATTPGPRPSAQHQTPANPRATRSDPPAPPQSRESTHPGRAPEDAAGGNATDGSRARADDAGATNDHSPGAGTPRADDEPRQARPPAPKDATREPSAPANSTSRNDRAPGPRTPTGSDPAGSPKD